MQVENKDKFEDAVSFYNSGNLPESEKLLKSILKDNPDNAEAYYYLGLIASRVKKFNIAAGLFNKAISIKPSVDFYINLGNTFFALGNYDEAIKSYQKIIDLNPDSVGAYNNQGVAFEKKGDTDNAIKCYRKAIEINPQYADAYSNLGTALNRKEETQEAIEIYFTALKLNPNHVDANYNLGVAYKDIRDLDNALKYYEKAHALNPDYKDVYLNLGIAYLLKKDFERGWKYYEYRFTGLREPAPEISPQNPKWDGSSLKDKTIYVYHEQGLGDTIQFLRFLPLLNAFEPKRILFKCQKGLESLLKMNLSGIDIINKATPDNLIEFDTYIPLLSLPYHLKTNYDNIPCQTSYLKADINKVIGYREKFFKNDKFKVGIFWQGSTEHKRDNKRSIPLKYFYPLSEIPNIQLYSLQKGYGSEQLQDLPENLNIIDLGSTFNEFSDTAAAIENLDLVIGIDSALSHLAGALGKPVWIILSSELEWRWFLDEKDTIWYESARLFRPELKQDRADLMDRIFKALHKFKNKA